MLSQLFELMIGLLWQAVVLRIPFLTHLVTILQQSLNATASHAPTQYLLQLIHHRVSKKVSKWKNRLVSKTMKSLWGHYRKFGKGTSEEMGLQTFLKNIQWRHRSDILQRSVSLPEIKWWPEELDRRVKCNPFRTYCIASETILSLSDTSIAFATYLISRKNTTGSRNSTTPGPLVTLGSKNNTCSKIPHASDSSMTSHRILPIKQWPLSWIEICKEAQLPILKITALSTNYWV